MTVTKEGKVWMHNCPKHGKEVCLAGYAPRHTCTTDPIPDQKSYEALLQWDEEGIKD